MWFHSFVGRWIGTVGWAFTQYWAPGSWGSMRVSSKASRAFLLPQGVRALRSAREAWICKGVRTDTCSRPQTRRTGIWDALPAAARIKSWGGGGQERSLGELREAGLTPALLDISISHFFLGIFSCPRTQTLLILLLTLPCWVRLLCTLPWLPAFQTLGLI